MDVPITKCLMTPGEIGTTKLHKAKIPMLEIACLEVATILITREMVGTGFKVRNDFNPGVLSVGFSLICCWLGLSDGPNQIQ